LAWVYRHTCGQARRILQTLEEREQPFKPGKKLTAVELRSITKTPVPESYQVLGAETGTEASTPTVKTALWTGTFSVGRIQLPTLADALDNRLGLCVTAAVPPPLEDLSTWSVPELVQPPAPEPPTPGAGGGEAHVCRAGLYVYARHDVCRHDTHQLAARSGPGAGGAGAQHCGRRPGAGGG
jgi:hypothetical protein